MSWLCDSFLDAIVLRDGKWVLCVIMGRSSVVDELYIVDFFFRVLQLDGWWEVQLYGLRACMDGWDVEKRSGGC